MIIHFSLLVLGLFLLYFGSEILVRGAASTALLFAVRPVIVGLTVVAFATSAPELLVSLMASIKGSSEISVGNILGSNVINIALVLGISALIKPIALNRQIVRFDIPYMLASCLLFWILSIDGTIGHMDGALLFSMLIFFLMYGIKNAKDKNGDEAPPPRSPKRILLNMVMIVGGIAGLAQGADLVVQSAIVMAKKIGWSEAFIGISVVALGTSLPELATSAVAAAKGESDLSVGNVVGSNLFNICMVMGSVGLLTPMTIDRKFLFFEFPLMIFIGAMLFGIGYVKKEIGKLAGAAFMVMFCVYIGISYINS